MGTSLLLHSLSSLCVLEVPLAVHVVTNEFDQAVVCGLLLYRLWSLVYRILPSMKIRQGGLKEELKKK